MGFHLDIPVRSQRLWILSRPLVFYDSPPARGGALQTCTHRHALLLWSSYALLTSVGIRTLANELPSNYPNSNAAGHSADTERVLPAVTAHMLICELLTLVFLFFLQSNDSWFFQVKLRWCENYQKKEF